MDAMRLKDYGSGCPEREVSAKPAGHASTSDEQEEIELGDVAVDAGIDSENQTNPIMLYKPF